MIDVIGMRAIVVHTDVFVIPVHIIFQVNSEERAWNPAFTKDLGLSSVT